MNGGSGFDYDSPEADQFIRAIAQPHDWEVDPLWQRAMALFPNSFTMRMRWVRCVKYLRATKKGWVADSEEARAATFQGQHL